MQKDLQCSMTPIKAFEDSLTYVTRTVEASLMSLEPGFVLCPCIPGLLNVNEPKQLNASIGQNFLRAMIHISNHKLAISTKMLNYFPLFFAFICVL